MNEKCNMTKSGILSNLEKGLVSEHKALDLCTELLPLVDTEEEREDLKKIIGDETKHIRITQELMEIVNNDYNGMVE
jgi:rubrerythrin